MPADVVIIGAGIVGMCAAYRIAQAGRSVTVIDRRGIAGGATGAATGIVPRLTRADSDFARLCEAGRAEIESLLAELGPEGPRLRQLGALRVVEPDEREAERTAYEAEAARGVPCEWLGPAALRSLEPAVSERFAGAIRYPETAHLDAAALCRCLAGRVAATGGRIAAAEVTAVAAGAGGWTVRTTAGDWSAGAVVAATGAWAGLPLPDLGAAEVRPVRGQAMELPAGAARLRHIVEHGPTHLVPTPDGTLLAGATSEEVGYDDGTTAAGLADVAARAADLVPALAGAVPLRTWAGLRPKCLRRLPIVGPVPGRPGAYFATGHYKSGVLLGPVAGRRIAELIDGN